MPLDFSELTDQQKNTVTTTEGPVLVIAGPGTGKTFTLVQRLLYLMTEKEVSPEKIMVVTFTEKAAKEIKTRIYNGLFELQQKGEISFDSINVDDIRIGTFHAIFLDILMENIDELGYDKNLQQLDDNEQLELVVSHWNEFKALEGADSLFSTLQIRKSARILCEYLNSIREELISPESLQKDEDLKKVFLGNALIIYNQILHDENKVDFSGMLTETYRLFSEHPNILQHYQDIISYIMVDEYQDTNLVQEKLVLKLGGSKKNICVVGDDDQSLYRFRGANVSNILDFENRFGPGECRTFRLVKNFRSPRGIVDLYNKWMDDKSGCARNFEWKRARLSKIIETDNKNEYDTVIKCEGQDEEWYESIYKLIKGLKDTGKVTNYNQIAFLAARKAHYGLLIKYLESKGIDTYAPRYGLFFERKEVKGMLGCLIKCIPDGQNILKKAVYKNMQNYYDTCIAAANDMTQGQDNPLGNLIAHIRNEIANGRVSFTFSDLIYQMIEYEPFRGYIKPDSNTGVFEERPARNISKILEYIKKYEISKKIDTSIGISRFKTLWTTLFSEYIVNLKYSNVAEYEDDSEYAPSGCVSFMTIHQSKGMEFPVVITALDKMLEHNSNFVKDDVLPKYREREDIEPEDLKDTFDYWRLYYTAFSRAQSLLVLATNTAKINPHSKDFLFGDIYAVPRYEDADLLKMKPKEVKNVELRQTYSFTSHLGVYDTCPKQFYFYKDLAFTSNRSIHAFFGTLVHETIEDMHKEAIAGNAIAINAENVERWFNRNYNSLRMAENTFLSPEVLQNAKEQVLRYMEHNSAKWNTIRDTEVEVSVIKQNYILLGKVDLVQGVGDTYELVDFKTGKKPDEHDNSLQLRHYKEQLITYSHLISERTGKTISRAHLYYPGVEEGDPRISFDVTPEDTEKTLKRFDEIVEKIQQKDFSGCAEDASTCRNCDFKYYCHEDSTTPASRIRFRRNGVQQIPLPLYGYIFSKPLDNGQKRRPNFHTHLDCEKLYNKPVNALNVFQSVTEANRAGYFGYCKICRSRDEED